MPLHVQIDTYDDPRDPACPVFQRAYAQIKVFCDLGAYLSQKSFIYRKSSNKTRGSYSFSQTLNAGLIRI